MMAPDKFHQKYLVRQGEIIPTRYLPADIMNNRIESSLKLFLDNLNTFFTFKKWKKAFFQKRNKFHWNFLDVELQVTKFYPDQAINYLQIDLHLPGISGYNDHDEPVISYYHQLSVSIPRTYPNQYRKISITNWTNLINPVSFLEYKFNNELEILLMDVIFMILQDKNRIITSNNYMFESLLELWNIHRVKRINQIHIAKKENKRVGILE